MGDFFLTKLPVGHSILSMAPAFTSLHSEPALDAAVAAGVGEARRQCAAMSWLLSDIYSPASFQKLSEASRLYALRLCGLDAGSRGAAAQATRIHAHLTSHHPHSPDRAAAAEGAAAVEAATLDAVVAPATDQAAPAAAAQAARWQRMSDGGAARLATHASSDLP